MPYVHVKIRPCSASAPPKVGGYVPPSSMQGYLSIMITHPCPQASALGELSVRRGETVEVIEEVSPSRWQVRNKFGGTGQIPIQNAEVLQKKKSKGRETMYSCVQRISLLPGP